MMFIVRLLDAAVSNAIVSLLQCRHDPQRRTSIEILASWPVHHIEQGPRTVL